MEKTRTEKDDGSKILFDAHNVDKYTTGIAQFGGTVCGLTSVTKKEAHAKAEKYLKTPAIKLGLLKSDKQLTKPEVIRLCELFAEQALKMIADYRTGANNGSK